MRMMNKVNKMVRDLINVSARLADEKDYDNKIAPTLQGIINYLKKLKKKSTEVYCVMGINEGNRKAYLINVYDDMAWATEYLDNNYDQNIWIRKGKLILGEKEDE